MGPYIFYKLIIPRPKWRRALSVDGRCLSLRLSVPCLSRMEGRSKLKIDRTEARDTVTRTPFGVRKIKLTLAGDGEIWRRTAYVFYSDVII